MEFGIFHNGIRTESAAATFNLDASITSQDQVGQPVTITGNYEVGIAGDGDPIHGILESFESRITEGGVKTGAVSWVRCACATYEGTAPVAGASLVGSATSGTVKASATASNILVTNVNTADNLVDFIIR